jgi:hypothetical protein
MNINYVCLNEQEVLRQINSETSTLNYVARWNTDVMQSSGISHLNFTIFLLQQEIINKICII